MIVNWNTISEKLLTGKKRISTAEFIDDAVWLNGIGAKPCDIMIVGQHPMKMETNTKSPFSSQASVKFMDLCRSLGMDVSKVYLTYAVKHASHDNSAPKEAAIKLGQNCLLTEIEKCEPKVIICLGTIALKAVAGKLNNKYRKLTDWRGTPFECDRFNGVQIVATYHPSFILRQADLEDDLKHDIKVAIDIANDNYVEDAAVTGYDAISSKEQLSAFLKRLYAAAPSQMISLDAEWEGAHPTHPGAYLRMIQLCGGAHGEITGVIRFYPTATPDNPVYPDKNYPDCVNPHECMAMLKTFMGFAKTIRFFGHNIQSDSHWFIHYGFDIREYVNYDTMLMEHILDNRGPFRLTELTLRWTDMGRYDRYLQEWKEHNPELVKEGYGSIPEDIIFPYGAGDVQAVYKIMQVQIPKLRAAGLLNKRGEYPSLAESVIRLSKHVYELHATGMRVNMDILNEVTAKYEKKKMEQLNKVTSAAASRGWSEFNPDSTDQVRGILYNKTDDRGFGLAPVKTTSKPGKSWEWVMAQAPAVQARYNPSTDKDSLKILAAVSPFAKLMNDFRGVAQICKNFVRSDGKKGSGINGNIWPDGRIHAEFSLLTSTGRLRSAKPNVQNFPKKAEGDLVEVFGDEPVPSIRRVFEAEPGWFIVEADYKQAELFVLAGMSGDEAMLAALMTPGEDLHDKTAIGSFQLKVLAADGVEVNHEEMLALAAVDIDAFESARKSFIYVDPKGHRMTYDEFKNSIRVSAKAINFGIPYGRGAEAIAQQINAETGLGVTKEEIQTGLDGWKRTYPTAWRFMEECGEFALAHGYIENAWGRRRYFDSPSTEAEKGSIRREASNHPIQGTVADTMVIAIDEVINARNQGNYRFRVINQVHDALVLEVPEDEMEDAERILVEGMGNIGIPMKIGPTKLGVDVDVYTRWGEKLTK